LQIYYESASEGILIAVAEK